MSSAMKLDLELLGLSDSWTSWILSEPFSDRVACLGRSTRVPFKKLCWKVWLAFFQMHFYLKTVTCCELLGFSYTLWHPSKWSRNDRNHFVFNCSNLLLFPWDRKVKIMTFWEICAFDFVAVFLWFYIHNTMCLYELAFQKSCPALCLDWNIENWRKSAEDLFATCLTSHQKTVRMIFSGPKGVRTESG